MTTGGEEQRPELGAMQPSIPGSFTLKVEASTAKQRAARKRICDWQLQGVAAIATVIAPAATTA